MRQQRNPSLLSPVLFAVFFGGLTVIVAFSTTAFGSDLNLLQTTTEPTLPAAHERASPPDADTQARAETEIKELDSEAFKASSADAYSASAQAFFHHAEKNRDDQAGRFVLLCHSRDYAVKAGDYWLAQKAIAALSDSFVIDVPAMELAALRTIARSSGQSFPPSQGATSAWAIARLFIERADYKSAVDTAAFSAELAKKSADKQIIEEIRRRTDDVSFLKGAAEKAEIDQAALAKDPNDPAANLEVGKFYCLAKGDWARGLPYLSKGSDEQLKHLADRDAGSPVNAVEQIDLGNAWWKLGETYTGLSKENVLQRASYWYRVAVPSETGLARKVIEARIATAENNAPFSNRFVINARNVCYLCQASGAMINKGVELKNFLSKEISALPADTRFSIIFYKGREILALNKSPLLATKENKDRAEKFLREISPFGDHDPIAAMESAFKEKPDVLYFLSNGDFANGKVILEKIRLLNKDKLTRVDTVLFVTPSDGPDDFTVTLRQIAKENRGMFNEVIAN